MRLVSLAVYTVGAIWAMEAVRFRDTRLAGVEMVKARAIEHEQVFTILCPRVDRWNRRNGKAQQVDGKIPADKLIILQLISGPETLGRACLIYAITVMINEREVDENKSSHMLPSPNDCIVH